MLVFVQPTMKIGRQSVETYDLILQFLLANLTVPDPEKLSPPHAIFF
jgi:hypothetical protein